VVKLTRSDFGEDIQKRVFQWFSLGLSLAPLLSIENGPTFVRSLVQLIEEYDYHFVMHPAVQGVKVTKLSMI